MTTINVLMNFFPKKNILDQKEKKYLRSSVRKKTRSPLSPEYLSDGEINCYREPEPHSIKYLLCEEPRRWFDGQRGCLTALRSWVQS